MVPLTSTALIITPLNITKEAKNALHGAQFQIPVVFLQIFQKIPDGLRGLGPGNHDLETKNFDNIIEIIFMVHLKFDFFVSKIVKIVKIAKIAKIVKNCSKIMKKNYQNVSIDEKI